jgi:hypothetical protein
VRTTPDAFRAALYKSQTNKILPVLMEIDHDDLAAPLYLCNNTEAIVYGGHPYQPVAFKVDFPDESDAGQTSASVTICNIDQQMVEVIRTLETSPTITITAVLYDGTNVEPVVPMGFTMRGVSYDAMMVQAELIYEDRLENEMLPIEMNPQRFPGIF